MTLQMQLAVYAPRTCYVYVCIYIHIIQYASYNMYMYVYVCICMYMYVYIYDDVVCKRKKYHVQVYKHTSVVRMNMHIFNHIYSFLSFQYM